MADNTARAGTIVPGDDLSAEWGDYYKSAQRDILAALGAQTRVALEMLHDKLGVEIEMDWESTAREVCSEALASLQIQAHFRLGSTPEMIAAMCRESAGEPQAAASS